MSYEPTIWQAGDVITAEKLNKIEQALYELSGGGGDEPPAGYVTVAPKQSVTLTGSEEDFVKLTIADGYVVFDPLPTDLLVKVNGTVVPYMENDYIYYGDSLAYEVTLCNSIDEGNGLGFLAYENSGNYPVVAGTYEVAVYAPQENQ